MVEDFGESFWNMFCEYTRYFFVASALLVLMLVTLLASLLTLDPGTGSYIISLIDIAIVGVTLVISGSMFLVCYHREQSNR